jgi:phosphocarrier protein FPr
VIERKVTVRIAEGLHARPATEFVKLARSFVADIEIARGEKSGTAKSPVKLMLLGVKEGDEIALRANGVDEAQALEALCAYVSLAATPQEAPKPPAQPVAAPVVVAEPAPAADGEGAGLRGLAASEGAAIGPAFFFDLEPISALRREIAIEELDHEVAKLRAAVATINAELTARSAQAAAGSDEAEIVEALAEIAQDVEFVERVEACVRAGQDAVSAAQDAGALFAAEFEAMEDPYQRARADDVRAVARKVALSMLGKADATLADAPPGSVILAREISAFDLAGAALERFGGLICTTGGPTSHVAIIARSYGLPAVLGLAVDAERLRAARVAALDGATGEVALDPDEATERRFREHVARNAARRADLQAYVGVEPRTRDGRRIEIAANLGSLKEIDAARAVGAMGVGLFRTELLFMERRRPPTEDEQAQVYARLAEAFAPAPVIVRTLDVGGDKPTPGLEFPHEDNPFLGWRGIRMCLDRPEVFKPQLRALLRAAVHGNVKVMLPMIADVEEIRSTKRLIEICRAELEAEKVPHAAFELGVMAETPAAALIADDLAREVAFFSIGTNDLTQYVMAADRQNPKVAALNRADHPAVLRAIDLICQAARRAGIWVGVCGEAASRPELIPKLVSLGVTELSMAAASILRAKKCVTET